MNRAERRGAGKRTTPATIPFLDAVLDQRVSGGCADCDAYSFTQVVDGIYHLSIYHDDTCPFLNAREGIR